MQIVTAYKYHRNELKLLNFWAPSAFNETDHGGEPWVDALIYSAYLSNNKSLKLCLSSGMTTCGDTNGISILVLSADSMVWNAVAKKLGCRISEEMRPIETGRFGDPDTSILIATDGDYLFWIDENISPATAELKQGSFNR